MIADKALWVIERNSNRPLTLKAIAEACGVSRSHLASAFGSATGMSVVKYLRARRLSEAARVLTVGAQDILSVALATGYGSHEAFTRAFHDQFDLTPEAARAGGRLDGLAITPPLELKPNTSARLPPPRFERIGSFRAVGLAETLTYDTVIGIPAQWRRFMAAYDEIEDVIEGIPIGVCHPAREDGTFDYVCAAEVCRFGAIPQGMTRLEIGAGLYAVFEHCGHVSTIFNTYSTIWNDALPATGRKLAERPVIERHNETFDPQTGEGGLTLWIPVIE